MFNMGIYKGEQGYLDLMRDILEKGDLKNPARENMPPTKELFGETLVFDLQEGIPLLTTKTMFTKGIIEELLFFLRGSADVTELIQRGVNIWNEDGYKFYKKLITTRNEWRKKCDQRVKENRIEIPTLSQEEWVEKAKKKRQKYYDYQEYDLGNIYGRHWRNWGGKYFEGDDMNESYEERGSDQIKELINTILKTPNSRYQIVTAWDPITIKRGDCALPSCHILFQTNIRNGEFLDLNIYQRSADTILGVPFNIASYAFLIHILSFITGYKPGILKWIGGSVHIYENQIDACNEQLLRKPKKLPNLKINEHKFNKIITRINEKRECTSVDLNIIFNNLSYDDFTIENYNPYPIIKAPLSTGLKLDTYKKIW